MFIKTFSKFGDSCIAISRREEMLSRQEGRRRRRRLTGECCWPPRRLPCFPSPSSSSRIPVTSSTRHGQFAIRV